MENHFKPYITFFIISILAISAGIYIYYDQSSKIKSEIYSQLTYISNIKRNQISNWIYDRVNDFYSSSHNKSLMNDINSMFENKGDKNAEIRVKSWFEGLRDNKNYIDAYLIDPKKQVKLILNSGDYFDEVDMKYLDSSIKNGYSVLADFHVSEKNHKIHVGVIIPLHMETDSGKKVIGLLLQIINPDKTLFPLIQSWPTETKTAETLIIRADGDSVLYLNELRHRKNAAMRLKVPISDTTIPAVMAVRGYNGIKEGVDYRGVPVLSYVSKIDGSNWYMVSKEDIDEALFPLEKSSLVISFFVVFFIFITGVTIAFLWKKQESSYFEEKYALQKAAEESSKKALMEKEVLLKELNHRTKNNMQIITSLISLKASSLQDKTHIASLSEIKYKILAISLVHEKLQQAANLSVIDLKEYLTDLVIILCRGLNDDPDKIKIILELENVNVNIDTAISCGLIINEIISNSIKHAFPGSRKGYVKVELHETDSNFIQFKISDDGVGFKEESADTLGLNLFRNIAEGQLMAEVDVEKENGVAYTILFRNNA